MFHNPNLQDLFLENVTNQLVWLNGTFLIEHNPQLCYDKIDTFISATRPQNMITVEDTSKLNETNGDQIPCMYLFNTNYASGRKTFIQRRINVDATSWRCIDVDTTCSQRCVPAGIFCFREMQEMDTNVILRRKVHSCDRITRIQMYIFTFRKFKIHSVMYKYFLSRCSTGLGYVS